MSVATDEMPVAVILWRRIKEFRSRLNIVESPSVGTLRAPANVCALIGFALEKMLASALALQSQRVWVICTVDHSRRLLLEVIDDSPWQVSDTQAIFHAIRNCAQACYSGQVILNGMQTRNKTRSIQLQLALPAV